jgi:hypothetical protein
VNQDKDLDGGDYWDVQQLTTLENVKGVSGVVLCLDQWHGRLSEDISEITNGPSPDINAQDSVPYDFASAGLYSLELSETLVGET